MGVPAVVVAILSVAGAIWLHRAEPLSLAVADDVSRMVVDRDGRLLRPYATREGLWRLPVRLDAVDPRFVDLLLAYEDRRFWSHVGVDPLAMARAGAQFLAAGRIVSGGSTITMQVARLLEPREERSLLAKAWQMLRAIELERRFDKRRILEIYLTLAPYGGNVEGLRAATLTYFGKEPRRLSLGEAALLVALPQAPEARRPDRAAVAATGARDRVLARLLGLGAVDAEDAARARAESVPSARRVVPMHAAHLSDRLIGESPEGRSIRTTIDQRLQASLETMLRERMQASGPHLSAAVIVADNADGAVRAHVASAGLMDTPRRGAVDMTNALRSPGSALKPFVYGLAFEDGLAHPETLMEDRPLRYGVYAPENFDLGHQGTVTARRALQLSLNVPLIELLSDVRPARFLGRLREAGARLVLPRDSAAGLAVGLGGLGITLEDMTRLYVGLARGGETIPLRFRPDEPAGEARRLLEPVPAWYVADVLRGTPAPDGASTGRFAYKTGTSYGYRDAWAVGFDRRWTIAVWVGRADGAPVAGLTGRTAAAPLLFEAVARLGRQPEAIPAPDDALRVATHRLPPPLQAFGIAARAAGTPFGPSDGPLRIAFPPDGARIEREPGDGVVLRATGGVPPLLWMVDGRPLGATGHRRAFDWTPSGAGFARVTVQDATGETASVLVRLE